MPWPPSWISRLKWSKNGMKSPLLFINQIIIGIRMIEPSQGFILSKIIFIVFVADYLVISNLSIILISPTITVLSFGSEYAPYVVAEIESFWTSNKT